MLRLELLPRRDLADVAVVGVARVLVVDDDAFGVAARPRLQVDGAQVGDVLRVDDIEALVAHEAHIGRILLGPELVRQFLGNDEILVIPLAVRLADSLPSRPSPGPFAGPRLPPAGLRRRLLVYQPPAASATAGRRNAVAASAKMAGIMSPAKPPNCRKATAVAPKTIPPAAVAGGHRSRGPAAALSDRAGLSLRAAGLDLDAVAMVRRARASRASGCRSTGWRRSCRSP